MANKLSVTRKSVTVNAKPKLEDGWYWVQILEELDVQVPLEWKCGTWYDSRGLPWHLDPLTVGDRIPYPKKKAA